MLKLLGTSCWYRDNCITKLWSHCSYFLYLYMVFLQHFFHSEQHFFHVIQTFQTDWVYSNPQSSLFMQNSCSVNYLCIMSKVTCGSIHVIKYFKFTKKQTIAINTCMDPPSMIFQKFLISIYTSVFVTSKCKIQYKNHLFWNFNVRIKIFESWYRDVVVDLLLIVIMW